jgi:hypothetical protein
VIVWGALLALTAIEVFLAYIQINATLMLIILIERPSSRQRSSSPTSCT